MPFVSLHVSGAIFNPRGLYDSLSQDINWKCAVFFSVSQSDTYTCFRPIFFQQTFDWESGEIFSFCIRQWTTGIHHEIKGFGRTELNTDLKVCSPAGPLQRRDPLQKWNKEPALWFQSNSDLGVQNEWNYTWWHLGLQLTTTLLIDCQ